MRLHSTNGVWHVFGRSNDLAVSILSNSRQINLVHSHHFGCVLLRVFIQEITKDCGKKYELLLSIADVKALTSFVAFTNRSLIVPGKPKKNLPSLILPKKGNVV